MTTQGDVDFLENCVKRAGVCSSAKVNWGKSEALMVGSGLQGVVLPAGLTWRKGGFKYLGVFLGNQTFLEKNWDSVLEKVEGRLRKWKWILPKLSFRGRVLIVNNLVASMLWHRLACVDPPVNLLARIQSVIVDFFWDRLHWVPQSVLFLPREEGGQGLIHLASRGAAFRLQFAQRLLSGPVDLVWRPVAQTVLAQCGGLGLQESLFLMDLRNQRLGDLPRFYQTVFKIWGLFKKDCPRAFNPSSWILKEPVVYGTRFKVTSVLGSSVMKKFITAKITTLGHVVDLCGPNLNNVAALSSALGVSSVRSIGNLLRNWRDKLTQEEQAAIISQQAGSVQLEDEPFPLSVLSLDFKDVSGVFLISEPITLQNSSGKQMYKLLVKILNKDKLKGRADTSWRVHLGLGSEVRPAWRALYKPPLSKKVGDLQWRVLHGAVAVNSFISVLNPTVDERCPFCFKRETVFHCFLDCSRLNPLFEFLERMFGLFGEIFSPQTFILGFNYCQKRRVKCELLNFILGQAKMAVYISRREKVEQLVDCEPKTTLIRMIRTRVNIDFNFYRLMDDLETFENMWCYKTILCSLSKKQLVFGLILT